MAQQREAEAQAAAEIGIAQQLRAAEQALLEEKMENLWEEDATEDISRPPESVTSGQGTELSAAAGDALQLLGLSSASDRDAIR